MKTEILNELIACVAVQQAESKLEILTKDDLLKIFPWKTTKLNQLLKANILPVTKIGNDYITTPKQIQSWLESHEGREIMYIE